MNWPFFMILAYLLLGIETGLAPMLRIEDVEPSLLLVLAMYVAMSTSPIKACWCCLLLGMCTDLTHPIGLDSGTGQLTLVGPSALGFAFGGWVVVQLRGMVFRHSITGLMLMAFVGGAFTQLLTVAILAARAIPWIPGEQIPQWSASAELINRFFELLYTVGVAFPLGYLLIRLEPFFRFDTLKGPASGYVKR